MVGFVQQNNVWHFLSTYTYTFIIPETIIKNSPTSAISKMWAAFSMLSLLINNKKCKIKQKCLNLNQILHISVNFDMIQLQHMTP